jgi:hypothetical protein
MFCQLEGRVYLFARLAIGAPSQAEQAVNTGTDLGQIDQRRAFSHIMRFCAWPYSPRCAMVECAEELLLLLGRWGCGSKLVFCDRRRAGKARGTQGRRSRCSHDKCDRLAEGGAGVSFGGGCTGVAVTETKWRKQSSNAMLTLISNHGTLRQKRKGVLCTHASIHPCPHPATTPTSSH